MGEHDVLLDIQIKLAKIETTLEMLATSERMAKVEASAKSAHKRIDETERRVYWIVGVAFVVVETFINVFIR